MYINLPPSVVVTVGASYAAIFDMEANIYASIPKEWGEFLDSSQMFFYTYNKNMLIKNGNNEVLADRELINFLIENQFGLVSDRIISFDRYHIGTWEIPFQYETLLIDADSSESLNRTIAHLPKRQFARFTQIRLFYSPTITEIDTICDLIVKNNYYNCDIVTNFNRNENVSGYYNNILLKYPYHLSKLILMNSLTNADTYYPRLILNKRNLENCSLCGHVDRMMLSINIDTYMKYYKGNTCLWKKISVDSNGEIKNCPSMNYSYGNIEKTDILKVLYDKQYLFYSNIKKNQIKVCRDCEFRIFCTDCRFKILNKNDIYSKPECEYNPFIKK